jgi:hypothetical protein
MLLNSSSGSTPPSTDTPHLSEEWSEQFEQVMQADRDFFLQYPEQEYYLRPITPVEVREGQSLGNAVTLDAQVLVGEVIPGSRIRLTIMDGGPPPMTEFRLMQKQMRQQMGMPPKRAAARPPAKGFGNRQDKR